MKHFYFVFIRGWRWLPWYDHYGQPSYSPPFILHHYNFHWLCIQLGWTRATDLKGKSS